MAKAHQVLLPNTLQGVKEGNKVFGHLRSSATLQKNETTMGALWQYAAKIVKIS